MPEPRGESKINIVEDAAEKDNEPELAKPIPMAEIVRSPLHESGLISNAQFNINHEKSERPVENEKHEKPEDITKST